MKKKFLLNSFLFSISLLCLTSWHLSAQITRYVKEGGTGGGTSWADASGNLQSMMDAVKAYTPNGGSIWVAEGTYSGQFSLDYGQVSSSQVPFTMLGGFPNTGNPGLMDRDPAINLTNLSGNTTTRVLWLRNIGTSVTIDGFIFKDGNANTVNGQAIEGGGAVENEAKNGNHSSPHFIDCKFQNNTALRRGGAVMSTGFSGGGIANIRFTRCEFTGNSAMGTEPLDGGGAVGIYSSSIGGGTEANGLFVDCTFTNNTAHRGGAIIVSGAISAIVNAELVNVTMSGNQATQHNGGGIYVETQSSLQTEVKITNSRITGNKAQIGNGGGLAVENTEFDGRLSTTIWNTTFSGNNAAVTGGAIFNSASGTDPTKVGFKLTNVISWNNKDNSGTGSANSSYAIDGSPSNYLSTINYSLLQGQNPSGTGNLDGTNPANDPDFITALDPLTAPSTGGDFHLLSSSPAINMGTITNFPADIYDVDGDTNMSEPTPDLDKQNRIVNTTIDFGPYEFTGGGTPSIAISGSPSQNEGNSGTTAFNFTVTRTGNIANASSASWAVTGSGGNPANAADFGGTLPSGTVTFPAGSSATQTITVNVSGDTDVESNEGFTVTLSNPTNATITTATASGTILNDDSVPVPSIAISGSPSQNEGNSGTTAFNFTVTRTGNIANASSASWAVTGSGGNPANAADFGGTLPSGTVTFPAGSSATQTITVNVSGDTDVESNEGFTVTLSNPTNATITTATASGTILNDDIQSSCPPGNVIFVNDDASGSNNGTSWANAFNSLQTALSVADTCPIVTQIWVAAGTYKPTAGTDRTVSFVLKNNLAIYGGFNGTEANLGDRPSPRATTILSGDIGTPFDNSDNSYHVATGTNLNNTAVLDGFIVKNGNANGTPPEDRGGGMRLSGSAATISNCIFTENAAGTGGGMSLEVSSSPSLVNCAFQGNTATFGGGLWNAFSGAPTITNCTFSGNAATIHTGGFLNSLSSTATLTNCIFWGNTAPATLDIRNEFSSSCNISHTFLQDPSCPTDATCGAGMEYGTDPLFVSATDLHLQSCSPAKDAGTAAGAPATDFDGNARPQGAGYDLGFDENGNPCTNCNTYGSTDTPLDILDQNTITSIITMPMTGTLTDVNILNLSGTHTYSGDLIFRLTSPQGTTVVLIQNQCGDLDNFNISLDDQAASPLGCPLSDGNTQQPQNPLSVFNGENAIGSWILSIEDNAAGDVGTLTGWMLGLCTTPGGGCPDTLLLSGYINPGTYHAAQDLSAQGTMPNSGGTVVLKAGDSITLLPNFTTAPGGVLEVTIEGCTQLLPQNDNQGE